MNISDNIFGDHTQIHQGDIIHKPARRVLPTAKNAAFGSYAEQHNPLCLPGTRVDLLRQIAEWVASPSTECIFWLNGMAGTGKSTISRTVAKQFKEQGTLGASFFFKRGEEDRGHARLLFPTIASQLAASSPELEKVVAKAIDAEPGIESRSLQEQFEKLIMQPLHSNAEASKRSLAIVIDALDECDQDKDIRLIIDMLPQVKTLSSVHVKVFVTSRPELPIRLGFKKITETYKDITLHQIPKPVVEHDISKFFMSEFARIREDYSEEVDLPPEWPGKDAFQVLTRMAVPLFVFAATICRFIEDTAWSDPVGQLQKVMAYQFKASQSELDKLEATYLPVFDRLVEGKFGESKTNLISEFRAIVGPLVLLAVPLSRKSLADLLGTPETTIARRLANLHSILDISTHADAPIRMFHLSLRHFIVNPNRQHDFGVDEAECHAMLAQRCLKVLAANSKRDICDMKKPAVTCDEINRSLVDKALPAHLQYACLHWVHHVEQSKSRVTGEDIYLFLKHHFLYWLEALLLLKKSRESLWMIETLQKLAEPGTMVDAFLRDASLFTLNCMSTIVMYPLQLYTSAIMFSPANSMVRNTFEDQIPTWTSPYPKVDLDWNTSVAHELYGHKLQVLSVAWSPKAQYIATASDDWNAKVWDSATGVCLMTLSGHSASVRWVAWSHNGDRIMTTSDDGTIKIWEAVRQCILTIVDVTHVRWTQSKPAIWSHDSTLVACVLSDTRAIKAWDAVTGRCVATLEAPEGDLALLAWSRRTTDLLASIMSHTNEIKLWSLGSGKCTSTFKSSGNYIESIAWRPESNHLISASGSGTIETWDATTSQLVSRVQIQGPLRNIAWSHDASSMASALRHTIKLYKVASGQCISTFSSADMLDIRALSWANSASRLASISVIGPPKIWSPAKDHDPSKYEGHDARVEMLAVSNAAVYVASLAANNIIKVWDSAKGSCVSTIQDAGAKVRNLIWSKVDFRLAILSDMASFNFKLEIWDQAAGQYASLDQGKDHLIVYISWSPTTVMLAAVSPPGSIRIWDTSSGTCIATLVGHTNQVSLIAWSHDSARVVSVCDQGTVKIWNVITGECISTTESSSECFSAIACSHSTPEFALATFHGGIHIWDLATCQQTSTLQGSDRDIHTLDWSADAARLVSASRDGVIRIWQKATGQVLSVFHVEPKLSYGTQFDKSNAEHLKTKVGTMHILLAREHSADATNPSPFVSDGFNASLRWLTFKGEDFLFLPWAYRSSPRNMAFHIDEDFLVIGSNSGRVSFIDISNKEPMSQHVRPSIAST